MAIIETININTRRVIYSETAQNQMVLTSVLIVILIFSILAYLLIFRRYIKAQRYYVFTLHDKFLALFMGFYNIFLWVFAVLFTDQKALLIGLLIVSGLNSVLIGRCFLPNKAQNRPIDAPI